MRRGLDFHWVVLNTVLFYKTKVEIEPLVLSGNILYCLNETSCSTLCWCFSTTFEVSLSSKVSHGRKVLYQRCKSLVKYHSKVSNTKCCLLIWETVSELEHIWVLFVLRLNVEMNFFFFFSVLLPNIIDRI